MKKLLLIAVLVLSACEKEEIVEVVSIEPNCDKYVVARVWDIFDAQSPIGRDVDYQRVWFYNRSNEHLIDSLVPRKQFSRGQNIFICD